jgi:dipeptidyl aminopeptidase/acylaminoacyl peptidase
MQPGQLADFAVPSDPRLHPDGVRVAFTVTTMDLEADRYVKRIWMWDGTRARPLTAGPGDTAPRWSPDGTRLAFLRTAGGDESRQVALLPIGGGEASVVTSFSRGATEIAWSPGGDRLAVVAAEWVDGLGDLDDHERARRPRRIRRVPYRYDDDGWIHERRRHVYLVDPAGDDPPRQLTFGEHDDESICWSPDGGEIAFLSARHEHAGLEPGTQVWTAPAGGGEPVARTAVGPWSAPGYDPAGRLHAVGAPDPWAYPGVLPLQRIGDDGALEDLTGHLDRSLTTPTPPVVPEGPHWSSDGRILSTREDAGRVGVIEIGPEGTVREVIGGDRVVTGIAPRPDGSAFAFVATTPVDPGELWWWEDGEERRLTALNEPFRAVTPLAAPRRFTIAHDGVEVEGWVYLPEGEDRVPVLLNIHGGPATQYGYQFFDEFQVYVGAGYGVVAINPRGSTGYGQAHVRAVVDVWHEPLPPDLRDLLAAVDAAGGVEPRLDTERVGVMGGSYGGLMTVRVAAAEGRFRSAVAERGLYVWSSFSGTSDIGPWFDQMYLGSRLPDGAEQLWKASPLAAAHQVRTPTLILHSDADWRCPVEQAEQLFVALLRAGVETELVRFPADEGHELSRSGSPRHRLERFEIILDWHARHLG